VLTAMADWNANDITGATLITIGYLMYSIGFLMFLDCIFNDLYGDKN
jgi:hypothetical protein